MLNFNTQKRSSYRYLSLPGKALKAVSPLPNGLTSLVAVLLICFFTNGTVQAQCNPDTQPPSAVCVGPFTVALNGTGQYSLSPADIDNGSSDNCGPVTLSINISTLTCAHIAVSPVSIVLTVKDQSNLTNTCTTLVTVQDNLPPVFITCPGPKTVNCVSGPDPTSPASTGIATASDNCGGLLSYLGGPAAPGPDGVSYTDAVVSNPTGDCSTITRTWTATYNTLTNSSCVQTISVQDLVKPVIVDWNTSLSGNQGAPGNVTVICPGNIPAPIVQANVLVTDNCGLSGNYFTHNDVSNQNPNPAFCDHYDFTINRTYTAIDACGNPTIHLQTITVKDDVNPTFTGAPTSINIPANANCQGTISLDVSGFLSDNCAANNYITKTWAIVNTVNGQTVASGTGLNASGTYPAGTYLVTFFATDPCGNLGQHFVNVNIVDNVAPTAACNGSLLSPITLSIPPTGLLTVTPAMLNNGSNDNCTPQGNLVLSVTTNVPFDCSRIGILSPFNVATLTVTDANGNSNSCSVGVNIVDNSAPAVFCRDTTVYLDATGMASVHAQFSLGAGSYDACDPNLQYRIVEVNGITQAPLANPPIYTFDCSEVGANTVKIRVRDNFQNDAFCTANVTVLDIIKPNAVCNNITIPLNQDGMASIFDVAQQTSVTSTPGTVIPSASTGSVSTVINIPTTGVVQDVNVTLNISHDWIGDLSATLTSPNGIVVNLFDRPGVPASTFGCQEDDILATFDEQAPNLYNAFENACSMTPPAITGIFQSVSSLAALIGEDLAGNWTLTVTDHATPDGGTIDSWTLDITYNTHLALAGAGTTDNCGVTWSILPDMFSCSTPDNNPNLAGKQVTYTLTATDPSSNTKTCTGTITVIDPIAPVISCEDRTMSIGPAGTLTVLPTDFVAGGMYLSSGNDGINGSGSTQYCITAPNLITFSFDWDYESQNTHPGCDPFGYSIGGTANFTQLTTGVNCGGTVDGPLSQSGTATVSLTPGQQFCFQVNTVDNILGRSEVWITNFSPIFTGAFAPANWTLSNNNANGKGFFYDACGLNANSWQIRRSLDGGSTWTGWGPNSTFSCSNIGAMPPIEIEIRATDVNGNTTTCGPVNLTVIDKQAPQAQCQPLTVSLNSGGAAVVPASDFNFGSTDVCCAQNTLVFRASKNNGPFSNSLTFGCSDVSNTPIPVILEVTDCVLPPTDPNANKAFCQTTITIKDFLPPAITCPANITINCDQSSAPAFTGFATATDNCPSNTVTIWHTDSASPQNSPNCQVITRTWRATDATPPNGNPPTNGNISVCFQTITVIDNVAPTLVGNAPNVTVQCTSNIPVVPTVTRQDNCAPVVNITPTVVDSRFTCGNPVGSANCFNANQPGFYNYTVTRTWNASDNCGNPAIQKQQVITVADSQAPTFGNLQANMMVGTDPGNCSKLFTLNLANYISDNCAAFGNLTITYKVDSGPVQNGSNISSTLNVGTHTILITADDPSNLTPAASFTLTIQVKDTETPVAKCKTGPLPVVLSNAGVAPLSPADVNNNSTDNCGVASLNVSPNLFNCTHIGIQNVTLTVVDASGNPSSCTTTVNVMEGAPPVITCPAPATVNCGATTLPATTGVPTVVTSCTATVIPTYVDVVASGNANCGVINRTWTANNGAGTAQCVQTITVQDNIAPVLANEPVNVTVDCDNIPNPANVTATDNCASPPAISYLQTSTQGSDPALCGYYEYTITRTWTATDNCGNTDTHVQTITVDDKNGPSINIPNPLIVNAASGMCNAAVNINLLNYIDDCADDQYLTVSHNAPSGSGATISGTYAVGNYTVTVMADDVCPGSPTTMQTFTLQVKDGQTPVAVCHPNVTVVLDNTGNGTITPADVDNGSTDNCGIVNMTLSQSSFNAPGQYPVILTVFDAEGLTGTCNSIITVEDRVFLNAPDAQGGAGNTIQFPITVENFGSICGLDFSLDFEDDLEVDVLSVGGFNLPGLDATDFNIVGNVVSVNWVNGTGVTLNDGDPIFHVNVQLTGINGDLTDVSFDVNPMVVKCTGGGGFSNVAVTANDGSIEIVASPTTYALEGEILTEDGAEVGLVQVAMSGTNAGNDATGATGEYGFTVPSGASVTITPTKDINPCNGVNTLDVQALQMHILNVAPLTSGYKLIASDVNNDGNIDVLDRIELHFLVVGNIVNFLNNDSWVFVNPAATTFPFPLPTTTAPAYSNDIDYTNVLANHLNGDFVGVKVGNLTSVGDNSPGPCMFDPQNMVVDPAGTGTAIGVGVEGRSDDLHFVLDNTAIEAGNEYRIEFKAKDFNDLIAYEYRLGFNKDVLQFKEVEMGVLPALTPQHFGTTALAEGIITAIWYDIQPATLADDEVLFTIVFDAIGNAAQLSDLLSIEQSTLMPRAWTSDYSERMIDITFNETTGTADAQNGRFELYQNIPNPFANETVIPFYLPNATHAMLTVSDVSGKNVKILEGDFSGGYHQFKVSREDLPANGVFFYRLETENGLTAVRKMILLD